MHTIDAIKIGETHQRLHVLAGWWESKLFSNKEKLALELTEKITKLHETHFEDEFYDRLEAEFTEQEFVDLVILIAQINVWNTFGVVFAKDIDENYK
jgi:alkylhydroperoxidase family enzyme